METHSQTEEPRSAQGTGNIYLAGFQNYHGPGITVCLLCPLSFRVTMSVLLTYVCLTIICLMWGEQVMCPFSL